MTILYLSCSCVFGIFQCLYFHYVTACSLSRSLHPSFPMSVLVIRMFLGWLGSRVVSVAGVTAGLAESNGSLPSGLWLTTPAGWLPRTGISFGTLRSVIEYGLLFYVSSLGGQFKERTLSFSGSLSSDCSLIIFVWCVISINNLIDLLLDSSVRSAPSLLQFRRDLKTALHVSVIVLFTIVSSCVTQWRI